MRTVGIIVEYNPLHNGHVYHFEQSKLAAEADACIAVMSGHFLQRGEPALVGKWARAEMALRMGADVVIELPVAYSSQPAEWFAYGAVKLLDATGVVDALCFGSEDGRIDSLAAAARRLVQESPEFRMRLQEELRKGLSYPSAYAAAGTGTAAGEPAMDQPNNILGLHYLMALHRLDSTITPLTVTRVKAGYHETAASDPSIASATALRKLLLAQPTNTLSELRSTLEAITPYVPPYTLEILEREFAAGRGPITWESFAVPLFHQLLSRSAEDLNGIAEVTEGLEHRIKAVLSQLPASSSTPVEDLLLQLKTKRYTRTKLQRTLLRILLQHPKHELTREKCWAGPSCLRILGFSDTGRHLLKRMKKTASLPLLIGVNQQTAALADWDIRATSVYSTGFRSQSPREWLRDYYEPPLQL